MDVRNVHTLMSSISNNTNEQGMSELCCMLVRQTYEMNMLVVIFRESHGLLGEPATQQLMQTVKHTNNVTAFVASFQGFLMQVEILSSYLWKKVLLESVTTHEQTHSVSKVLLQPC